MPNLEKIKQDYKRGRMSLYDIGWLIQELVEAKQRISDLEGTAERWMKQSITDSIKLIDSNKRILELEKENSLMAEKHADKDIALVQIKMDLLKARVRIGELESIIAKAGNELAILLAERRKLEEALKRK